MQNKYSKKQLEELYNCDVSKIQVLMIVICFWWHRAYRLQKMGDDCLFVHANGWDLDELHENIREAIREHCIVFDGE